MGILCSIVARGRFLRVQYANNFFCFGKIEASIFNIILSQHFIEERDMLVDALVQGGGGGNKVHGVGNELIRERRTLW